MTGRLNKAEFKKMQREGRLRSLTMDESVDLEKLSADGKTPALHSFRGKMFLEIEPAATFDPASEMNREFGDRNGSGAWAAALSDTLKETALTPCQQDVAEQIAQLLERVPTARRSTVAELIEDSNGVIAKVLDGLDQREAFELLDRYVGEVEFRWKRSKAIRDGMITKSSLEAMQHLSVEQKRAYLDAIINHRLRDCRKILASAGQKKTDRLWAVDKDYENIKTKLSDLRRRAAAFDDVKKMDPPQLQRLGETGFHKYLEAFKSADIVMPDVFKQLDAAEVYADLATEGDLAIFVVQHDWSAAFAKAQDFEGGEFLLPYDEVVFEFRISGRRCCFQVNAKESHLAGAILLIETSVGWAFCGPYEAQDGKLVLVPAATSRDLAAPIIELCLAQVRAMTIALEAEVAETEVIRAPHKLNAKRERHGKLPIFDHHVVHLANRKRYAPRILLEGEEREEHRGKRLHFVRGHHRHYSNHKVWIKWHLRGNPDLGFIDKEYRL